MAQSLSMICPYARIDGCDYWQFTSSGDVWKEKVSQYDHVLYTSEIQQLGIVDFSSMENSTMIPIIQFRAFHPDLHNVFLHGQSVKSPLDDYHSTIAFAAHQLGMDKAKTRSLYTDSVYEKIWYYTLWESEKKFLIDTFSMCGLDVRNEFTAWVRRGAFMHSGNHPKAQTIYDMALLIARKISGDRAVDSGIIPHDTLVQAPIYPVFPEIAERFGVSGGSYFFKGVSYRVFSLDEFIEGSFDAYDRAGKEHLQGNSPHLSIVMQTIEAFA
ncbi:hypothetical protein F3J11_03515 [Burkholderia sp. Cy-647]|nr:hypothetical protein [Burkholderia sp. Tr-860]NIF61776.1 hypothetical protein [Burkholderia sp. Cy-647]NIF71933.1 hypothetical protein [Burkholderia sp. Ap-962]NIF94955.1 hypothetical protein [Burkholderia sp. Ax-1720]